MVAFKETTKATGYDYKYVKASNQASLLMGDLGNVKGGAQHKYSNIEAEGGYVVDGKWPATLRKISSNEPRFVADNANNLFSSMHPRWSILLIACSS
jgi:hypothetical protein